MFVVLSWRRGLCRAELEERSLSELGETEVEESRDMCRDHVVLLLPPWHRLPLRVPVQLSDEDK